MLKETVITTLLVSSPLLATEIIESSPKSFVETSYKINLALTSEPISYMDYLNKLKDELTAKFDSTDKESQKLIAQINQLTTQLQELTKMANMFSKMLSETKEELTKEMQAKLSKQG